MKPKETGAILFIVAVITFLIYMWQDSAFLFCVSIAIGAFGLCLEVSSNNQPKRNRPLKTNLYNFKTWRTTT